MQKIKNKIGIISLILLVLLGGTVVFSRAQRTLVPIALADDDDERENDDEDEYEALPAAPVQTESVPQETAKIIKPKIEYQTVYQTLPDTIINTTIEIPRYDSDGDGIYDDEDPHPDVNEFLIVKDDNLNGIDDRYEK